jgi:DNA-directed RNA polymerase subunit RPC12/RpoP
MTALSYNFKCANCGADFVAPEVPESSYGIFVMRSENTDEARSLNALNDSAFLESYELVKQNDSIKSFDALQRGALQQKIFGVICDRNLTGEKFAIGLLPRCPHCGSRKMESWEQTKPIKTWILPSIQHIECDNISSNEKHIKISEAIRRCL